MSGYKMNELKNKSLGNVEEIAGKVTDNKKLEAKGKTKKAVGKAYELADDVQPKLEEAKDKVIGTVKEKTGELTGNQSLAFSGKVQQGKASMGFLKKVLYSLGAISIIIFLVNRTKNDQ